jgi:hypothetical protein
MPRGTARQIELRKLFGALCPRAPYDDAKPIIKAAGAKKFKHLPPSIALWLALIAHIRHRHTDYDRLLGEGYDQDSARHFTREKINDVLKKWGCARQVKESEET